MDRVAAALAVLDGMEAEDYINPFVAAAVRKAVGEPPRHWPPQPGDVWTDENPVSPLWFAQVRHGSRRSHIYMVPMVFDLPETHPDQESGEKTPEDLLESSIQLALAYRKDGGK